MIIDCHVHLDSNALPLNKLIEKLDDQGIGRAVLMSRVTENVPTDKAAFLLTAQRFLCNSNLGRPLAALASYSFHDENGNLRFFWKPFTGKKAGYQKTFIPDNDSVVSALNQYPDRFWGWIFLNPKEQKNSLELIDQYRETKGMVGIKVHPYWHQYPIYAIEAIAGRAEELKLPILIHMGFGSQGDYLWILRKFPKLNIIFSHCGMPFYKKIWPVIREYKNAFIDVSSPHLSASFVESAVQAVGAGKVIFGTDSPYGFTGLDGTYDYGAIKKWVEALSVSEEQKNNIFGLNFLRLIHV